MTPTLDREAMVKVAVIGRKWISYDDEDTFRLKADAARKLCLGGGMVWAVSQDYTAHGAAAAARKSSSQKNRDGTAVYDTRYSKQLQEATQYGSPKALDITYVARANSEPSPNCGAGCPAGYVTVPRLDKDAQQSVH